MNFDNCIWIQEENGYKGLVIHNTKTGMSVALAPDAISMDGIEACMKWVKDRHDEDEL